MAIWTTLLILLASGASVGASTAPPLIVRQRARQQLGALIHSHEPSKDVFALLTEPQKQAWSAEGGRSISEFKDLFTTLPTTVVVEVKLLGFEGLGGEDSILVTPDDLARYLQTLSQDLMSVVLNPEVRELATKPIVRFQVSQGPRQLIDRISSEISRAAHLERARPDRASHEQLQINFRTVDALIEEDAKASRGPGSAAGSEAVAALTVYLINPRHPGDKLEEYVYSYEEPGQIKQEETRSCPGTLYVSTELPAYVWVDIRAGPTSYGPGAGHRGQVHSHTLPHPIHYKQHSLNQAIAPDLAALAWSAVQHMAWPPMLHANIAPKPSLLVHIVHIHDTLGPPRDRVDQDAIKRHLQGAVDGLQTIEVKETFLAFAHCDLCMSIYASALKVRTAREDGDVYLQARTTKILDRLMLHKGLQEHKESITTGFPVFGSTGLGWGESATRKVLPVFVFDISEGGENGILIDGLVKATAFSDMVIAVSSTARTVMSHFRCKWSHMYPPAGDVTRELLASILSAAWGVPDTSSFYSGAGEGEDYRWSVGNTPFGPLSSSPVINAVLAQTARRNLIISQLDEAVTRIERLLDAFAAVAKNGRLDATTLFEQRGVVLQRLNMAHFKLSEAVRLLGQWQAAAAYKYAHSMLHDAKALESAARAISVRMDTGQVKCDGATTWRDVWWAPVGALALWPLAFWVRSKLYTAPKMDKIY